MEDNKYKQDDRVESIISLCKSEGWKYYKEELIERINILNKKKDSLLLQHKDREAGETLARQKELGISLNWAELKLNSIKKEIM